MTPSRRGAHLRDHYIAAPSPLRMMIEADPCTPPLQKQELLDRLYLAFREALTGAEDELHAAYRR